MKSPKHLKWQPSLNLNPPSSLTCHNQFHFFSFPFSLFLSFSSFFPTFIHKLNTIHDIFFSIQFRKEEEKEENLCHALSHICWYINEIDVYFLLYAKKNSGKKKRKKNWNQQISSSLMLNCSNEVSTFAKILFYFYGKEIF